jgi:ArsR family transcriptional regulator, arsenate/arsenite/antimonite-responsive transcriptional repressor
MIATRELSIEDKTEAEFLNLTDEFRADIAQLCKMLADANRLRIVFFLLKNPELNVTEICDRLEQSQPAVSHHLGLLKQAGILRVRRDGKHNFYSICRDKFHGVMIKLFASMLETGGEMQFEDFLLTRHEPAPAVIALAS